MASVSMILATEEKIYVVVKTLEIIGEAARHLPKSVRDKYKTIPWKQVTGMRDRLTHEYFSVDLEVIWRTVHEDLPALRDTVKKMLQDLDTPNSDDNVDGSKPNKNARVT